MAGVGWLPPWLQGSNASTQLSYRCSSIDFQRQLGLAAVGASASIAQATPRKYVSDSNVARPARSEARRTCKFEMKGIGQLAARCFSLIHVSALAYVALCLER